jgi:hypothetical protein
MQSSRCEEDAMKRTTVALDDRLLERIRARARKERRQLQDCINELLALGLAAKVRRDGPRTLPTYSLGEASVDLADREALHDLLESE